MVKRRTWVNITVCHCLHSSLTHNIASPVRKQSVRDLYFCKEVYSFVSEVVHYGLMMFQHVSVYLYMYTYSCTMGIQHLLRSYIQLYGCTTWTLIKRLKKKLDGNYTRILRAILNKSWRQLPTRHQLYGHLPPITKPIQVRRTRHAGHCRRSRDELIRDVLLWTLAYGQAKAGRPARTYIQQLCENTGCNPEDPPKAMNNREKWREGQGYMCWRHDIMMMMIWFK